MTVAVHLKQSKRKLTWHTGQAAFCLCVCACVLQECLHRHACVYLSCVISVCFQVQNDLSQTNEKLHREVAQRQQLLEEFEQVAVFVDALFCFFSFLCHTEGWLTNSQWITSVYVSCHPPGPEDYNRSSGSARSSKCSCRVTTSWYRRCRSDQGVVTDECFF